MKIIVGLLYHETNTLSPVKTRKEDFEVIRGEKILEKLAVTTLFQEAGVEIIPTLYANALPSGKVELQAFLDFRDEILGIVSETDSLEGIWLYLHGSMEVETIGSGEADLISELRNLVGYKIPIALTLDFHANMTDILVKKTNIIYGYRTAPHTDQDVTQIQAGKLLLKCINEGLLPEPVMVRPPLMISGDMLTTTVEPGKSLIKELEFTEADDAILYASLFAGQPWVDAPNTGASVVVAAKQDRDIARREAKRLAQLFWEARDKFHFEEKAFEPPEAVENALKAKVSPVFITDSGDNTTAGAAGDDTYLLKILMEKNAQDVLVAGITDEKVVNSCEDFETGEEIETDLGAQLDPDKSQLVRIRGVLKVKGRILGWFGGDAGPAVVISTDGIDIIITAKRCGVVSPQIIESTGVKLADYRIIVVKQGYLWDALRKISRCSIIALTPGASCEAIEKIEFHNIRRPVYPLDKAVKWERENSEI